MGCSSSKPVADDSAMLRRRAPRVTMVTAGLKGEAAKAARSVTMDAVARASQAASSNGSVVLPLPASAGFGVRYAFITQRGYYPDAPDKANQDAVSAEGRLGGYEDRHMFAVFDGHGEMGTECAQFVCEQLANNVCSQPSFPVEPEDALSAALIAANTQLHEAPIDDCLSGTTACVALLSGRMLHVANVGDSRVVLAELPAEGKPGAPPMAKDLSQDQTPFRADECLRVINAGARVMTLDQLEGLKDPTLPCWTNEADCDGDPPRLWSPAGLFPGTAFTRSIGDSAAEDIGVIPDPEMTVTELGPQHPFVILASDGVWEFISSQKAVDIVCKYDDPYDAAKALVAQAYKLWLQKETRTDDISAVILFMEWPSPQQGEQGQQQSTPPQGSEVPPRLSRGRSRSGKLSSNGSSTSAAAAAAALSINAAAS